MSCVQFVAVFVNTLPKGPGNVFLEMRFDQLGDHLVDALIHSLLDLTEPSPNKFTYL